jgi:hypothetical protein
MRPFKGDEPRFNRGVPIDFTTLEACTVDRSYRIAGKLGEVERAVHTSRIPDVTYAPCVLS